MRNSLLFLFGTAFLCFVLSCTTGGADSGNSSGSSDISSSSNGGDPGRCLEASGPVACYGKLQAQGNKLIGSKTDGQPVILRGVSLGWSQPNWESGRFFNAETVNAMVDHWKAEIIRVPMGCTNNTCFNNTNTAAGAHSWPNNMASVRTTIDAALAKGVYVIIDWHSHNAHNEVPQATTFFTEMARDYGHLDNVIFEIYNEPVVDNQGTWPNIRGYAEQIIPVIRGQGSQNLILVGTPRWCQLIDAPLESPLTDGNIAYVFHFYSHSHSLGDPSMQNSYSARLNRVLEAGYPVFVSEYGTTHSDGGAFNADPARDNYNTHNAQRTDEWHAFMDANMISSAAWNPNYKGEGSAFFGIRPVRTLTIEQIKAWDGWTNLNEMTPSGQYVYHKLQAYAATASWRGH
ncbi:MAG: glycoside hydrolase family 5 protein [Fibromonadaceae bacterium]|jgi:endoglucanase|nr:glycoside hydrolase family 5 protein [Fibromonadaceae bacterium]